MSTESVTTARAVGAHEASTFFGPGLEAQTDVIHFVLHDSLAEPALEAIRKAGEFHKPGTGIAFAVPVDRAIGRQGDRAREPDGPRPG